MKLSLLHSSAAAIALASSSVCASTIFNALPTNTTNFSNNNAGTTAANVSLTGGTTALDFDLDGGNFFAAGFGSTNTINTLNGTALTDSDVVTISLTVDSVTHTGTSELRSRGIEFGLGANNALDGGSADSTSLILGIGGGGNSGNVNLITGTGAGNTAAVVPTLAFTNASIADGFTVTLTADVDGYNFSYVGLTATGATTLADVSGTFAPGEFTSSFGEGNFYLLTQKRNSNNNNPGTTTLDISAATISVIPEPSSFALLGFSTVGFLFKRRRA